MKTSLPDACATVVYRLTIPSKWTASTLIVKRTIRRLWYRRVLFDVPHDQLKTIDSSRFRDHSFVCLFQYRRARSFTRFMDRGAAPMDTRATPLPSEPSYPSKRHPSIFCHWCRAPSFHGSRPFFQDLSNEGEWEEGRVSLCTNPKHDTRCVVECKGAEMRIHVVIPPRTATSNCRKVSDPRETGVPSCNVFARSRLCRDSFRRWAVAWCRGFVRREIAHARCSQHVERALNCKVRHPSIFESSGANEESFVRYFGHGTSAHVG